MGKCSTVLAILVAIIAAWFGLMQYHPITTGIVPLLHLAHDREFSHEDIPDLTGRTFLVTGGNSGLGLSTATALARKGGSVAITCRSDSKCSDAKATILEAVPDASVETYALDLGSLATVRTFLQQYTSTHDKLDSLILNAGVMMCPYSLTADGIETQFGVNHIGHFAVAQGLMPLLVASAPGSRVTVVSSNAHVWKPPHGVGVTLDQINDEAAYTPKAAYGQSKLANILFANELSDRFKDKGVYVNSLNPGMVATNLMRHVREEGTRSMGEVFGRMHNWVKANVLWQPDEAALTQLWMATSPDVVESGIHGKYFHPVAREVAPEDIALDKELGRKLWAFSEAFVNEKNEEAAAIARAEEAKAAAEKAKVAAAEKAKAAAAEKAKEAAAKKAAEEAAAAKRAAAAADAAAKQAADEAAAAAQQKEQAQAADKAQ